MIIPTTITITTILSTQNISEYKNKQKQKMKKKNKRKWKNFFLFQTKKKKTIINESIIGEKFLEQRERTIFKKKKKGGWIVMNEQNSIDSPPPRHQ